MKKIPDFKDIYKLPLKQEEAASFMVMTADNQRAFDFEWPAWDTYEKEEAIPAKVQQQIIAKLNGDASIIIEPLFNFSYNDGKIWAFSSIAKKKKHIMLIRGWGHLTGIGGLHLKDEDAAKIQDDFGQYIVETLNNNIMDYEKILKEPIDLSQIPTWAIRTQMMSVYGDGKYLNTPEYKKAYNEMHAELQKRSKMD